MNNRNSIQAGWVAFLIVAALFATIGIWQLATNEVLIGIASLVIAGAWAWYAVRKRNQELN